MPFTLSHPAAVLPLLSAGRGRGPLIASALVAGSLAPDLPFFLETVLPGSFGFGDTSHTLWAVPTVDVVFAAAMVASWHGLLREPLVALLPDQPWADRVDALTAPRRKRGPGAVQADPYDAAWFTVSAAVGAFTHVAWDSFTHGGRCGVRMVPALDRTVGGMPVHHALQWGTSAVGLGLLAAAGVRAGRGPEQVEPRRTVLRPAARRRATTFIAASAVAGAVHRAVRELPKLPGRPRAGDLVATLSFGGGAGAILGATAFAVGRRLTARRTPAT